MGIKLNCDMGESFGIYKLGLDSEVIKYINMANLACGFHASDSVNMNESVKLCVKNGVKIGAHPSYQDLIGFGRRSMKCSSKEISSTLLYQIGALESFCKVHNTKISYVKPHGALYNDMMDDENIYRTILSTLASYNKNLKLMILSTSNYEYYENIANEYGIKLLFEVFADRGYNDKGLLVSRSEENSVITSKKDIKKNQTFKRRWNYHK